MDNEKQLGLGAETPPASDPASTKTTTTATPTLEGVPPVVRSVEPPPDGGLKAWMTIAGTFVSRVVLTPTELQGWEGTMFN